MLNKLKGLSENTRIVVFNSIAAFGVKGASLIISFLMMPAFITFFSSSAILGIWYILLSIITWIFNFDLGIGNGLRNKLTQSFADKDVESSKYYISSSYLVIGIITLIIVVLGLIIIPMVNWNAILNISSNLINNNDLSISIIFVFIGIVFQFFLRLISSILYALQKSAWNNLITLASSILQLLFIIVYPSSNSPSNNLIVLSFAYIFFTNIPLLFVTIWVFFKDLKEYIPSFKYCKISYAKDVLMLGGIFFGCQILYMITMNTNELIITNIISPEAVVEYQIYYKLFTMIGMLVTLALTPIWSVVTKAIFEKDYIWLKKLIRKLKSASFIAMLFELFLVLFLQIIVNMWLGNHAIKVNYTYAFIFAIFGSIYIFQTVLSTIVCGLGKMRLQFISYLVGVILKFLIIAIGISIWDSWIIVVIANIIVFLPYCILENFHINYIIKREKQKYESI